MVADSRVVASLPHVRFGPRTLDFRRSGLLPFGAERFSWRLRAFAPFLRGISASAPHAADCADACERVRS